MNLEEESRLIRQAKKDPAAFGVLYEQYYSNIFGYIHRRVLQWEMAQDITAEVFIKAYNNIWKFRWANTSINAWFYRIATNEVNMYFRKGKYHAVSLEELRDARGFDIPDQQTMLAEKEKIEQELQQYQDFITIQSKLKELPLKYQEVIALRYFDQKNTREISDILGKKEGTVKSLLFRGLEKMKNLL
jgi:RNA polymerase sigma-70 factor, ECF subfamily